MNAYTASRVRTIKENDRKLANIERNIRLGRYNGRNSAATEAHARNCEIRIDRAFRELMDAGQRRLTTLLAQEIDLKRRISQNRDEGVDRPELRARLNAARREIKEL